MIIEFISILAIIFGLRKTKYLKHNKQKFLINHTVRFCKKNF